MQLGSAYENTILSVHSALMRHDASYVEVCSKTFTENWVGKQNFLILILTTG